MRTFLVAITVVMLMNCSAVMSQKLSREDLFWRCFQANESKLFDFEKDQEKIFDELQAQLKKVNPDLTFEFGPKENGMREFVISAGGIKDAFPAVVALADTAPTLARWKIIRFRPRREAGSVVLNGLKISPDQIEFTIEPDGTKAGITLFIDGYSENDRTRYAGVAYLMLDHALGEYDVETKVGFIEFKPGDAVTKLKKQPFKGLVRSFDEFMASR
jgi:hypothetical protein